MTADSPDLKVSAAGLARSFDDSFAAPQQRPGEQLIPVLVVKAGGSPHAIALSDLRSFSACTAIVALPRQRPACLGLVAYRGAPIPMYSLSTMLGFTDVEPAPRWMAVTHAHVAVGIHALVGHVQANPNDLIRGSTAGNRIILISSEPCPLVDLASLIAPFLAPALAGRTT